MAVDFVTLLRERLYCRNENGRPDDAKYIRGIIDLREIIKRSVELQGGMIGENPLATR